MRTWLNDARSYIEPVGIGQVMRALGIGEVTESKAADFKCGDLVRDAWGSSKDELADREIQVYGSLGWQEYWQGSSKDLRVRK